MSGKLERLLDALEHTAEKVRRVADAYGDQHEYYVNAVNERVEARFAIEARFGGQQLELADLQREVEELRGALTTLVSFMGQSFIEGEEEKPWGMTVEGVYVASERFREAYLKAADVLEPAQ